MCVLLLAGSEQLLLAAARASGLPVFVSSAQRRSLCLPSLPLPPSSLALLSSNASATRLHAAPLWALASAKRIQQTLRHTQTTAAQGVGGKEAREGGRQRI